MKNGMKTAVLMAAMGTLLMVVGRVLFGGTIGVLIGLVIGLAVNGFAYWRSDKLAIRSARAVEVLPGQIPQYHAIMTELTQLSGLPMPKLYVSPEQQPNAFATGRNPSHAAVCVTEGLLKTLSWDEIRGVLAHELAHVKNRDILTGSVAAAIGMVIGFGARISMYSSMGRRGRRGPNPLVGIAVAVLAPLSAAVIQSAISRSREFEADRDAAQLIGDGESLARALEKLHGFSQRVPSSVDPVQASNYIINPLFGRRGGFSSLFATHPDASERVQRLRSGDWRGNSGLGF